METRMTAYFMRRISNLFNERHSRTLWFSAFFLMTFTLSSFSFSSAQQLSADAGDGIYYHLIVDSFSSLEKARIRAKELISQGYQAQILVPLENGNPYRISVYHAANRQDVVNYQSMIKEAGQVSGWILDWTDKGSISHVADASAQTDNNRPFYYLISGSYTTRDMAYEDAQILARHELIREPLLLMPVEGDPYYRVAIYYSSDRRHVDSFNEQIQRAGLKKGWVYETFVDYATPSGWNPRLESNSAPSGANMRNVSGPGTPKGPTLAEPSVPMFYLIASSFNTEWQAKTQMLQFQREGYKSTVLPVSGEGSEKYRVAIFYASDRKEVVDFSRKIPKTQRKSYWILRQ